MKLMVCLEQTLAVMRMLWHYNVDIVPFNVHVLWGGFAT